MLMLQTLIGANVDQAAVSSTGNGRPTTAISVSPVGYSAFDRCTLAALEKDLAVNFAGVGMRCFDHQLAHGRGRAVARDKPAVAGLHDGLDYDCRPKCSGGRKARNGSIAYRKRLIRADSKKYLIDRALRA
ncbi:MAG TPA: hypothetical protein VGO06_03885 [Bosea sp. (in: a-proteobacteria)]|jgi:hypothetical protein|uniref:hypothetical protein n=1 Tax=Bosea sp. (in: a-proteobacteria) TaxID=1871050 RepID=UPI002E10B621|nr:hypothetical protein [Bosea sp. (in: a-proteobacteria)]